MNLFHAEAAEFAEIVFDSIALRSQRTLRDYFTTAKKKYFAT